MSEEEMRDSRPIFERQPMNLLLLHSCWCINTNAIGVNVQVYTTSNKVMSIQDRLHRD